MEYSVFSLLYSSSKICAFTPPNPKELTPPTLGRVFPNLSIGDLHSSSLFTTKNGEFIISIFGFNLF
ncbi:hypothetical protein BN2127_JRS4_01198 [Bacillus cereus]|nr:hypothetical protein BN2127_JRS4_01198 [Bacillus cereus]